ncbi:hypothetical protein EBT25_16135, partial [bacterium]|nr:hypothetical protein [bacterium]
MRLNEGKQNQLNFREMKKIIFENEVKLQTPMQQLLKEVKAQYDESTDVSVRNELGRIYLAIKDVYLKKEKSMIADIHTDAR